MDWLACQRLLMWHDYLVICIVLQNSESLFFYPYQMKRESFSSIFTSLYKYIYLLAHSGEQAAIAFWWNNLGIPWHSCLKTTRLWCPIILIGPISVYHLTLVTAHKWSNIGLSIWPLDFASTMHLSLESLHVYS